MGDINPRCLPQPSLFQLTTTIINNKSTICRNHHSFFPNLPAISFLTCVWIAYHRPRIELVIKYLPSIPPSVAQFIMLLFIRNLLTKLKKTALLVSKSLNISSPLLYHRTPALQEPLFFMIYNPHCTIYSALQDPILSHSSHTLYIIQVSLDYPIHSPCHRYILLKTPWHY